MKKDKISFEIKWLENDKEWMLRVIQNNVCTLAPREDSVLDCLRAADEYCQENLDKIKGKVTIVVNYK